VADETPVRRLREHAADVPWRVEAGVSLPETVDHRPLSEVARLPTRATWVPRQRVTTTLCKPSRRSAASSLTRFRTR
jgi:hypothetical protein